MTRSRYVRHAFGVGIALTLVFIVVAPASAALVTSFPLPRTLRNADRIAPGPDAALWFTQAAFQKHTNALGRITTEGAASVVAIPAGSSVLALTAGPDGALWYAGLGRGGGGRLGQVTAAGANEFALPGEPFSANAIVTGPDQALWFTADDRIGRRAPDGVLTFFRVPGATSLERIVAAPDALWFITDSEQGTIGRITTSGTIRLFPVPSTLSAEDIAVSADGAIWFTSDVGNQIGQMTPSGRLRTYTLPNQPDSPTAITAGFDGAIWFTSLDIGRITPTGEFTEISVPDRRGYQFNFPEAITTGPDGAIWFTQQAGDGNTDDGSESSQIGKIDLPRIGKQLLVTRLADRPMRGPGNHLLRVQYTATRKASGLLRLHLPGRPALRRRVRAHAGSNSVTMRLPRKPGTYRLLLSLGLPNQSASDTGQVTVAR
jgi:virginiamycin B lyase